MALKSEKWAILYEADDYNEANLLLELFTIASERFGLLVEEP